MTAPTAAREIASTSRRALLAGAVGGIGAWAASVAGRANPVHAEGEAIVVGGEYATATSTTKISNTTTSAHVLWGESTLAGVGVYGSSGSYYGVFGSSTTGIAVGATSGSNHAVSGTSTSSNGVYGFSTSGHGMYGQNIAGAQAAVIGQANGGSTGVMGVSGAGLPAARPKTGVYGIANQDSTSKGVWGESAQGFAGFFVGKVYTSKFHEMKEISAPAAPASNKARLFVRDNGSGKTQLCVRFHTGGVLVIKTQP